MYSSIFMSCYTAFYWLAIFGRRVCRSNTADRRRPPSNSVELGRPPPVAALKVELISTFSSGGRRCAADRAQCECSRRLTQVRLFTARRRPLIAARRAARRAASRSPRAVRTHHNAGYIEAILHILMAKLNHSVNRAGMP